jgi:hypothetical protein
MVRPACGVTGYELALEYTFGAAGNIRTIRDLERHFVHDMPWGRINRELQSYAPFNARNFVFERDALALTAVHDGSTIFDAFGHITSAMLVSRTTVGLPCIVEFVARLPAGDGCWPALWLYDCHSGKHDASEIDVMESQGNPAKSIDRSMVFQFDHGPGVGELLRNPGNVRRWGDWRPDGPPPAGDLAKRRAAYAVHWLPDRFVKYVDGREGLTRAFRWTGPARPNLLVNLAVGAESADWTGPVSAATFRDGGAAFRLYAIRVFTPKPAASAITSTTAHSPPGRKRGVCAKDLGSEDWRPLGPGIRWWYNWHHEPVSPPPPGGPEFVPML